MDSESSQKKKKKKPRDKMLHLTVKKKISPDHIFLGGNLNYERY